ncbi:hypothetical protein [Verrucomicrobium sp. BvORR106]|uniref:hypothetical protein n=1 Tax=Verrucomicrobium sp. BvORR106 TaxID=1403819 RepID=UPI00056F357E|nr:hypothetical protein [Verrucomicrobium sp. BvORR106]
MIRILSLAAAVATLSLASCASLKKDHGACCDSKKSPAAQKECCDSKDKAKGKKADACCSAEAAKPAKKK